MQKGFLRVQMKKWLESVWRWKSKARRPGVLVVGGGSRGEPPGLPHHFGSRMAELLDDADDAEFSKVNEQFKYF